MGMRVEGISTHDSGNWTLMVQPPNWEMIRADFEIIVLEPHLTTDKDLPIRVQVHIFHSIYKVTTNPRWMEVSTLSSTFTTSSWTWASRPSPPSSPRTWRSSSPPPTTLSGRTEPTWSCQWPPGPDLPTGELGDAAWWMKIKTLFLFPISRNASLNYADPGYLGSTYLNI